MVRQGTSFLILICLAGQTSSELRQTPLNPYLHGAVPSVQPTLSAETAEQRQKDMLLVSAAEIIYGTNYMLWQTGSIRESSDQCVSFEIGFVFRTMKESYRKMLDLYNTTVNLYINKGDMSHIAYLEKVEQLHWEVYHYHNMMHEIEKKYKMDAVINGSGIFENGKRWTPTPTGKKLKTWTYTWKKTTSWWRPLEYGWNTDYYFWE